MRAEVIRISADHVKINLEKSEKSLGDQEILQNQKSLTVIWSTKVIWSGPYAVIFVNLYMEIQIFGDEK